MATWWIKENTLARCRITLWRMLILTWLWLDAGLFNDFLQAQQLLDKNWSCSLKGFYKLIPCYSASVIGLHFCSNFHFRRKNYALQITMLSFCLLPPHIINLCSNVSKWLVSHSDSLIPEKKPLLFIGQKTVFRLSENESLLVGHTTCSVLLEWLRYLCSKFVIILPKNCFMGPTGYVSEPADVARQNYCCHVVSKVSKLLGSKAARLPLSAGHMCFQMVRHPQRWNCPNASSM